MHYNKGHIAYALFKNSSLATTCSKQPIIFMKCKEVVTKRKDVATKRKETFTNCEETFLN
jgi:hypothetical protein